MTERSNLVSSSQLKEDQDQLLNNDEDSSYDSDNEVTHSSHPSVSRNVSETLGQELYDDYNSTNYRQYLEFSLKLGYSEYSLQQALKRLVNPTNNELLAELIKLGSTPGSNACDYGDIKSEIGDENAIAGVNEQQQIQHHQQDYSASLRPIVIDGSNVAMSHGNKEVFSCRGIAICVDWFKQRGHKDITVFVPKWRKESARPDNPIKDQDILNELEKERNLVYTPSRSLTNGKRMVCYDDRYILKLAVENDGIVVSNDNYRDLLQENTDFKRVVEERILMYSFVNDRFMPPDDPLGHRGPTLDNFLKIQPKKIDQQICPYGAKKKCTYGNKCKFYHPERGLQPHKTVAERLSDFANFHLRNSDATKKQQIQGKSLSVPLNNPNNFPSGSPSSSSTLTGAGGGGGGGENFQRKQTLCRTSSNVPNSQHLVPPPNLSLGLSQNQQLSPQQQQYRLAPGQALSASTSPTNNIMPHLHQQQQQQFPKSHSIDNLPREMYQQKPVSTFSSSNLWKQQQSPQSASEQESPDLSLNLHKKLQRQLSLLNPYDPRLFPMQQRYQQQQQLQGSSTSPNQQHDHFLSSPPAHKPLQASHSLTPNQTHSMYEHQNVMRIASAPNSSNMNWAKGANNHILLPSTSASEPQINYSIYEQRCRLHYHLSMIFPQKIVEEAMAMLPDETIDPQQICSTILSLQNLRQK